MHSGTFQSWVHDGTALQRVQLENYTSLVHFLFRNNFIFFSWPWRVIILYVLALERLIHCRVQWSDRNATSHRWMWRTGVQCEQTRGMTPMYIPHHLSIYGHSYCSHYIHRYSTTCIVHGIHSPESFILKVIHSRIIPRWFMLQVIYTPQSFTRIHCHLMIINNSIYL